MAKWHGTHDHQGRCLPWSDMGQMACGGQGGKGGTDDSTMSVTDAEKRDFDMCVFYEQWRALNL